MTAVPPFSSEGYIYWPDILPYETFDAAANFHIGATYTYYQKDAYSTIEIANLGQAQFTASSYIPIF